MADATQAKIDAWLSEQEDLVTQEVYGPLASLVAPGSGDPPVVRMARLCAVELLRAFMENAPNGQSGKELLMEQDLLSTLLALANIAYGLMGQCQESCGDIAEVDELLPVTNVSYLALAGALSLCGDVEDEELQATLDQPMANFIQSGGEQS